MLAGAGGRIKEWQWGVGPKDSSGKNFLFQGQRPVIVRLSDVSAADVVSLVRKEKVENKAEPSA